jgi:outer membrane immunogenic protein
MRCVRWLLCGLVAFGAVREASAADLGDVLRGSSTWVESGPSGNRWDGVYFGAQAGANWHGTDFAQATGSLVSFLLRNTTIENENRVSQWTTLGTADTSAKHFGGFIGYNAQWGEAVFGVEVNYNHTDAAMESTDRMGRSFGTSDGYLNNVEVRGSSRVRFTDYGTFRVRGGWAMDRFMPYGFVGAAVGRADVTHTASVSADGYNATTGNSYIFNDTATDAKTGVFAYGYTAGLGLDIALMSNLFIRGEWEYVQFAEFRNLKTHINSVRGAIALKF